MSQAVTGTLVGAGVEHDLSRFSSSCFPLEPQTVKGKRESVEPSAVFAVRHHRTHPPCSSNLSRIQKEINRHSIIPPAYHPIIYSLFALFPEPSFLPASTARHHQPHLQVSLPDPHPEQIMRQWRCSETNLISICRNLKYLPGVLRIPIIFKDRTILGQPTSPSPNPRPPPSYLSTELWRIHPPN